MSSVALKRVLAKAILRVLAIPAGIELDCAVCESLGWKKCQAIGIDGAVESLGYVTSDLATPIWWLFTNSGRHVPWSLSLRWMDAYDLLKLAGGDSIRWVNFMDRFGDNHAVAVCRAVILHKQGHWP